MVSEKLVRTFSLLVLVVLGIALVRHTFYNGQDFEVFWKSARHVLEGESLYSVKRDGAMVYKYPPWTLPFFIPFAWLPLWFAKGLWGFLQVCCITYCFCWALRRGVSYWISFFVTVCFWGIWAVHCLDGQVNLAILASVLFFWERFPAGSIFASTTKIFTCYLALGLLGNLRTKRTVFLTSVLAILFSFPAIVSQENRDVIQLFLNWKEAALSGAEQFGLEKVRGRENQSLTVLFLKLFFPGSDSGVLNVVSFVLVGGVVGSFWYRISKNLALPLKTSGWIALVPVVHPLAWFHVFVFSFPFSVLSASYFLKGQSSVRKVVFLFFLFGICGLTEKTLGYFGSLLEAFSVKSWSILGLMSLFLFEGAKASFPFLRTVQNSKET